MKRPFALLLLTLLLAACENRSLGPADAYQRFSDKMVVGLGLTAIGIRPCRGHGEIIQGTSVYVPQPTDQCFRMQEQKRWTGLWRDEFEGSRFCPAPATRCDFDTPGDYIWLNVEGVTSKEPDGRLYAVELLGRLTAVKGHYGHLGGANLELIADRLIQVRRPPPPATHGRAKENSGVSNIT